MNITKIGIKVAINSEETSREDRTHVYTMEHLALWKHLTNKRLLCENGLTNFPFNLEKAVI